MAEVPLRRARAAWIDGDLERAERLLKGRAPLGIRRAARQQALAAVLLERGDSRGAAALLEGRPRFPLLRTEDVGQRLLLSGRDREFLQYERAVDGGSGGVALYRAAALLNLGRIEEAAAALGAIDVTSVDRRKWESLRAALRERQTGSFIFIRDRGGEPLARYAIVDEDLVPLDDRSASWIDRSGGELTVESQLARLGTGFTFDSTIHAPVQRAAVAALTGSIGASLVAIDVRTGEILAIANSAPSNGAFAARHEPGAVMHPLILAAAIDRGAKPEKLFPIRCDGFMILNGKHLYDWGRHQTVDDLDEAMAVSCNVSFGRMALALDAAAISEAWRSFGFDSRADTGLVLAPLGRVNGGLPDEHAIASSAVGQERVLASALHLAVIAGAFANGGELIEPRLVLRRTTVLGDVMSGGPIRRRRVASPAAVRRVIAAMEGAAAHERGPGAASGAEGLRIAIKAGLSGSAARGYDNAVIAFAPVDAPRIAIGMIAENAGPDPLGGARVARNFFEAITSELGL